MPSYPRPEKPETGRSKDARGKTKTSRTRWKRIEREDASFLQDTYGKDDDPVYKHLMSSTGRIGHHVNLGADSTSKYAVGESKADKSLTPQWLMKLWEAAQKTDDGVEAEHSLPQSIADVWAQINQFGMKRVPRRWPVLMLSYGQGDWPEFVHEGQKFKLPQMHVLTPAHHKELVRGWLFAQAVRALLDDPSTREQVAYDGEFCSARLLEILELMETL